MIQPNPICYSRDIGDFLFLEHFQYYLILTVKHRYMHIIWLQILFLIQRTQNFWNSSTQNFQIEFSPKCVGEIKFSVQIFIRQIAMRLKTNLIIHKVSRKKRRRSIHYVFRNSSHSGFSRFGTVAQRLAALLTSCRPCPMLSVTP